MSTLSRYTRDEFLTPFDKLFDEVFNNFGVTPYIGSYGKTSFPKVDVVEYEDRLVLEADVSGLAKEDVSVELEGDTLTIRGGKKPASTEIDGKARYVYREIKRSSFVRSFAIGEGVDKTKIKVDYQNGAIKIVLPRVKVEEQTPKKVKLL
jgi:HSP20 family protein